MMMRRDRIIVPTVCAGRAVTGSGMSLAGQGWNVLETSSQDGCTNARAFYAQCVYDEEARIRDFDGPGDAKVTLWESLVDTTN